MAEIEPGTAPAGLAEARTALGRALLAALAAMILLPPLLRFEVDYGSFRALALLALVPVLFLPYVGWRRMWALRSILELVVLALLLAVPVLVFSYAAMRLNLPIADGALIRMDAALGFHWSDFVRLVDRSPRVATLLQYGYASFAFQLLLLPILLCPFGFQARAYRFMLAFLLLCAAAAAISTFFPSLGAYVAYGVAPASLRHVDAHFGFFYLDSFAAVRGQADFVLSASSAAGIITFPSVHAGVALLCGWAAWSSRALRYPLLGLNILMAVSAISHGAHYLVDVLAGGALAALAIGMATGRVRIGRPARLGVLAPLGWQRLIRKMPKAGASETG